MPALEACLLRGDVLVPGGTWDQAGACSRGRGCLVETSPVRILLECVLVIIRFAMPILSTWCIVGKLESRDVVVFESQL